MREEERQESVRYLRERERAEREAAASATDETARRLHIELANAYASRIRETERETVNPVRSIH